ncbi:MAG: NUDIX domain-containing protein [Candidatus Daviesbacteria bacterium]|nr:NUDIX domain-containing protein [Candidatus Daviesbacteria bacterium]
MKTSEDKVIWVDDQDNVLGEVTRAEAHQKGLIHRTAVVFLTNDKGQILIQLRDDGRLDHSSAGHVDPGESYLQAAKRELQEELGVDKVKLKEIAHTQAIGEKYKGEIRSHTFKIFSVKAEPGILNKWV